MKKSYLLLLCLLLLLGACGKKENELSEKSSDVNTEEPVINEELEEAPVSETDTSEDSNGLSAMLDDIINSMDTDDPELIYNHYYNSSLVYEDGITYRIFSDGIYRRSAGSEDWDLFYPEEMSRNHTLLLYKDYFYFTLNREGADPNANFVRQTLWQLNRNTLECRKIGDMVENLPFIFTIYDDHLYIGYSLYSALRYDVYPLDEQGMPGEKLEETSPEFICAKQNAFSLAQEGNWNSALEVFPDTAEMEEEVIPIPFCASMLNGYYLTQRPYTESLVHFYLTNAVTGEQQFLLDAYGIIAVTPTGLYCVGDESSMEQLFYYSFSRKEALPILYPDLSYEMVHLLTYDRSWLYLYCNDGIVRMSRSTGEAEVFVDRIPEDLHLSYCAVDPEYFYAGDVMYPL